MTERSPYRHHISKSLYFDLTPPPNPSSNIKGYAYDHAKKRLTVQFHDNRLYHHDGVRPEDFKKFDSAESVGKHYHQHIRGKFPSTRADEPKESDDGRQD